MRNWFAGLVIVLLFASVCFSQGGRTVAVTAEKEIEIRNDDVAAARTVALAAAARDAVEKAYGTHVKVEELLHGLAGSAETVFAVTGAPDPKKGERLVVLHTLCDEALAAVLERLPAAGLPNLWIPRADQFFRVEALPVLGTGKTDLRAVREIAFARSGALDPG